VRAILLSGIVLIALIVGFSLILTYRYRPPTLADLPDTGADQTASTETTTGGPSDNPLENVAVDTGNVQEVIATLNRSSNYSRTVTVWQYDTDSGSAVYHIAVSVSGDNTSMRIDGPADKKFIILAFGKLYVWYKDDTNYYVGPADTLGPNLSDEFQMILTYKDIVKLEKSSILEAGYTPYGGENCIYVKYISGALKYKTEAYISVKTGLLTGAEQYDGTIPIYSMSTSDFDPSAPDQAAFDLPGGKNALSAP
jgi:hypothetical protein